VDEEKAAGNYHVIWDGKDDSGKEVASGIYFYQLKTKDFVETKKMVLIR
jgi:flagellar hook assembly protein FlgD